MMANPAEEVKNQLIHQWSSFFEPSRGYYVTTRGCAIESSILCHSHDPTIIEGLCTVIMCVRSRKAILKDNFKIK